MYFHVDINSYFATMLQQENPALRGKPLGVIKDVGRTCVIASSNEAKKYGVKTGCRTKEAKLLCPHIIFVPAALSLCLSTTHKLKTVFKSLCPQVDIFSLDEAFLDMTGCELLMKDGLENFGHLIQKQIKETLGEWVQCNVGIAHNKLLAKLAGELGNKGGIYLIDDDNLDDALCRAKLGDVCGIGRRLESKLKDLDIQNPLQINLLDDRTLLEHFGPFWSQELRKIGRGEETHFFAHTKTLEHMQSVGRTITGYKLCDDENEIQRILLNLLEEATYKLRRMELAGRGVGVSLHGHQAHWGKHVTLKYFVRHTNEIFDILYHQLYQSWHRSFPIIKFGVWLYDLKPCADIPLCLLPRYQKNEKIYSMMDAVNNRFGLFTLHPATLLGKTIIRPEVTGFLGDKTYHGL